MMTLEEARKFFQSDRFATETAGIEIVETGENYARCRMQVDRRHQKVTGDVMGGAIFTLADFTYAVASNVGEVPTVTVNSSISFISGARGGVLTAESQLIKDGRSMCFYVITVKNEDGKTVAVSNVTGKHV